MRLPVCIEIDFGLGDIIILNGDKIALNHNI